LGQPEGEAEASEAGAHHQDAIAANIGHLFGLPIGKAKPIDFRYYTGPLPVSVKD
jgi:hypothetical protein